MKEKIPASVAHLFLFFTAIVWGVTFVASKLLLAVYDPVQLMLMRFVIAYVILFALKPVPLRISWREEADFAILGLTGCTLYFLGENYALMFTSTSDVSILIAFSPVFTAILAHFMLPDEKLTAKRIIGFTVAFLGVALVVFNGAFVLKLDPVGYIITIAAALCWAVYSVRLKKYMNKYDGLKVTRRVMLWGFITAFPIALAMGNDFSIAPLFADPMLIGSLLLLGVLGSAFGYVLWNSAIRRVGSVVANSYIYLLPFFTMIAAYFVLDERIDPTAAVGAVMIVLGISFSDIDFRRFAKK